MNLIQKNNLYKNPLVLLFFTILLVLIALNVYQYLVNVRSSDQILDAKSEIESYKMTSLELKERVEKSFYRILFLI